MRPTDASMIDSRGKLQSEKNKNKGRINSLDIPIFTAKKKEKLPPNVMPGTTYYNNIVTTEPNIYMSKR